MANSSTSTRSPSWAVSFPQSSDEAHECKSPIPYRIGTLDYYPPVYCKCQQKAVLWISWSDDNPGRRYLKCYKARDGGCDFIGWYEGRHDPFVQTLLIDLRGAVWNGRTQRGFMRQSIKEALEKIEQQEHEIADLKKEVARLDAFEGEKEYLESKVKKLELEKVVLRACCVVLVGLVVFLMAH